MSKRRKRTSKETASKSIILSLAFSPKTFYDLSQKETIASRSTIIDVLKEMESQEFVEREGKGPRGRRPYRLTWRGLVRALSIEGVYDKIDDVAKEYTEYLPLIFGKWQLFKDAGLRDLLIKRFQLNREAMELASSTLGKYREWDMSKRYGLTTDQLTFEVLCPWMVLGLDLVKLKKHMEEIGELDMMKKMRSFILGDEVLSAFIEDALYAVLQDHVKGIKYTEDWLFSWWGFRKKV